MSSFGRAVQFCEIVRARGRISIRELAEELDCSVRNVYKLVDSASEHLPIYVVKGEVVIVDKLPDH